MRRFQSPLTALLAVWVGVVALMASVPAVAAELIYFRSDACTYCEAWDNDIGGIYDKTDESKVLQLRSVDIHDEPPADLAFIKGIVYTPTFVAVENGREVGRIVGYGADIFFWQQLTGLVDAVAAGKNLANTACTDSKKELQADARTSVSAQAGAEPSAC